MDAALAYLPPLPPVDETEPAIEEPRAACIRRGEEPEGATSPVARRTSPLKLAIVGRPNVWQSLPSSINSTNSKPA